MDVRIKKTQYLVFDTGGTNVKYALMDNEGQLLEKGKSIALSRPLSMICTKAKRRKSAWTKGWQRFCRAAAVMSTASISASS
ncbi:Protein of unknown function [Lactobacillus delbrueckii subsp. lactis]|nr:Protein of unknown function [Lactobacillus delbrueckii subsp. lactis]